MQSNGKEAVQTDYAAPISFRRGGFVVSPTIQQYRAITVTAGTSKRNWPNVAAVSSKAVLRP
jgi:hypothetical protein